MKTYTIEFRHMTYTQIDVKARNPDEAVDKAFKKIHEAVHVRDTNPDLNRVWEKK